MEFRSAITLKRGDVITIPGIGARMITAIDQIRHDRYTIKLDEKFKESVEINIVIGNGEHRSPERHDGPWDENADRMVTLPGRLQEAASDLHLHGYTIANTPLLAGLHQEAAIALEEGAHDASVLPLIDRLCRRAVLGTRGDETIDIELLEESAKVLSSISPQE